MLKPLKLIPFTPNELQPTGWLKRQLEIQADGLAGHLHEVWPDIRDSRWVGGEREGWERVPYWLDGLIPLAFILKDDKLISVVKKYIIAILDGQQPDGWICPCNENERPHYDMWALFLICKVLIQYADYTGDEQITKVVYKAMQQFREHNTHNTLFNWGHARWYEGLITIAWLYERFNEEWLIDLALCLYYQGMNYEKDLEKRYSAKPSSQWSYYTHVVNIAMSLKAEALISRFTDKPIQNYARKALETLQKSHGMSNGHFTGDECLSGSSPIQGTELCGIVEAMYSYELLLQITGEAEWGDRLEQLAFNALPAAFSPDMWSHQYDQITNQIQCTIFNQEKNPFRTNSCEAHLFGLEPNFGCCTANFGQGWPKFALSAFMRTQEGIASVIGIPSELVTKLNGVEVSCKLQTQYPFRDRLKYIIEVKEPISFPFSIRIPAFAKGTKVNEEPVMQGSFYTINRRWEGKSEIIVEYNADVTLEPRPNKLYCLKRGNLLYAIPIDARWEKLEYVRNGVERKFPYCDYQLYPQSDWEYGFTDDITKIKIEEIKMSDFPFSPKGAPIALNVPVAPIQWKSEGGLCEEGPVSNKPIGEVKSVRFIPYGCTDLRITEIPVIEY